MGNLPVSCDFFTASTSLNEWNALVGSDITVEKQQRRTNTAKLLIPVSQTKSKSRAPLEFRLGTV